MKLIDIAKKLANDLNEDDGVSTTHVDYKKLNDLIDVDYPRFSSLLPYRYFWDEKRLFINEHSIGFGLELTVLSGADEKLVNSIADLLRHRIDDDMDVQFILWGSNQVGDIIDRAYADQLNGCGIHTELAKASITYYKNAAREGFKNKLNLPVGLREYRLFAFLSKKTPYADKAVTEIEAARESFAVELNAAGIDYLELTLVTFLPLLRSWINPDIKNIKPVVPRYEQYTTLNEQIVDKSFELINESDRLHIEYIGSDGEINKTKITKITNLSINSLPDEFALWESPDNFFNVFRASQAIRCPFLISMHLRLVPQAEAKSKAQSMYLGSERKAKTIYAKYVPGTQETALEWKKIRDDLASDSIRLAKTFFNLILFSNEGEEKRDESSAISCYRYNGIELFNTKYTQLQSFLATLPFVMSEGMYQDLAKAGRLGTLTTWNLANLLPIVADFKMCRKGVLLSSFRNQINFFDIFSDALPTSNYNMAIAATSGAGKSFLVQNILSSVLSNKGRCFVIDIGQSYRKFCEIVGGTYLEYSSLRLNPFTNIRNINEASEQIRDLLSVLASPSGELDDVQEEYLRQAVIKAWDKKQRATNIDDVIEALQSVNFEKKDSRIDDLIILLSKYSTTGPYPRVFNDYSAIAPDASFVVLELGELENKPDLMKAVLLALIFNIEEQMYQSPRNQQKMLLIDEAWLFFSGDNKTIARLIEKGARTLRKYLGSIVALAQSIEDFQKSEEAKAFWNCSDIKAIMLQNAKAFDDFMLSHEDYFDKYTTALIRQFKEAKNNGFSEFMLQTGRLQSFCRLFVDPFSRVMFSSAGKEFAAVREYQEQGLSIAESIMKVAQENYPDEC